MMRINPAIIRNKSITLIFTCMCLCALFLLSACGSETTTGNEDNNGSQVTTRSESADSVQSSAEGNKVNAELKMTINNETVLVSWEDNEAAAALRELASESPITIQMSLYGGFEQVGSIGQRLPRNDEQITTQAGDIVLYSGNQIVVFYGSNTWGYTKLGHITDKTSSELSKLLGKGAVTLTIYIEK